MAEHRTFNPLVLGSNPSAPTIFPQRYSPRVPPGKAPKVIVAVWADGYRRSEPGYVVWTDGDDQTALRLSVEIRLSPSGPTSSLYPLRCSKSSVDISSSATSSSLQLETRCCIDQLKPQPKAEANLHFKPTEPSDYYWACRKDSGTENSMADKRASLKPSR